MYGIYTRQPATRGSSSKLAVPCETLALSPAPYQALSSRELYELQACTRRNRRIAVIIGNISCCARFHTLKYAREGRARAFQTPEASYPPVFPGEIREA